MYKVYIWTDRQQPSFIRCITHNDKIVYYTGTHFKLNEMYYYVKSPNDNVIIREYNSLSDIIIAYPELIL